jgi:hypothetical protein
MLALATIADAVRGATTLDSECRWLACARRSARHIVCVRDSISANSCERNAVAGILRTVSVMHSVSSSAERIACTCRSLAKRTAS